MSIGYTYCAFGVDIVHCSKFLGSFDYCGGLDGYTVSEPFTLAVNDARDEEIASHAVGFGGLNNGIVGVESLVSREVSTLLACP